MPKLWAGIDAGKRSHHCVVINAEGTVRLSAKVDNDEQALLDLIATVSALPDAADHQPRPPDPHQNHYSIPI